MNSKYKWSLGIGAVLILLVAALAFSVSNSKQTTSEKNDVYNRILKTHKMVWGVKGDTKLMGQMDIKTGKLEGFDVDMAKEITKRIDPKAKVEYTQITSGTRIPMLLNGNIDAIAATMTITPERAKVVDFSKSYFNAGQSLLVLKGSSVKSVADLNKSGMRVLAVQGSSSVDNIKKVAPNATVVALQDYATALTALKAGQGDALTTDNGILYGMAAGQSNLAVVGGTFTTEPYGIAMDKNNPKLVTAVNKAIDEMRADGTYDKVVKKWFSTVPGLDWKELSK
jgi:putative glutamine transport system substrate-binding protein